MKLEWKAPARCDVLIAGAGLAGLRAAVDCARAGRRVIVAARGGVCSGSSFYPFTDGLGCQLPDSDADAQAFLEEVLDAGAGMASEELYRVQIASIRREVARLGELGITPYYLHGRAACFARRERTICAWDGWTAIRANVQSILAGLSGVEVWPHADLVRVLTNHGAVCGAVVLQPDGMLQTVQAPAVVLATGGPCGLYRHSLNTPDVTGAAASLALDAGAGLVNAEFLQFIPGLMQPKYKMLFCEITLWHCSGVTDPQGRPLLEAVLPPQVSVRECLRARSMHGPFTVRDASRWFDLAMMDGIRRTGRPEGCRLTFSPQLNDDDNEFVASARQLYQSNGLDLTAQPICIAPFAHCANGGVRIDRDGAAGVPGLYCAGEAAGGIHGADRHGGVATAAALVFGARAAAAASAHAAQAQVQPLPEARVHGELTDWLHPAHSGYVLRAADLRAELGRRLWLQANVLRTGPELADLCARLQAWRQQYDPLADAAAGTPLAKVLETFHALRTAEALTAAMQTRTESRGGHYRQDAPQTVPAWTGRRLLVREAADGLHCMAEDGGPLPPFGTSANADGTGTAAGASSSADAGC